MLPPFWTEVLEQIQAAIAQALADHPESEPSPVVPERDWQLCWQQSWERLQQRQDAFTTRLGRLEQEATAADGDLATALAALERWCTAMVQTQRSLAEQAGRTV